MTETVNLNPPCMIQISSKSQKKSEDKFDVVVLEAIEESLSSFRAFDKQEVYFHLKNACNISKREIPRKIEEFAFAMEQIFGIGSRLIEIRIIEALHKRIPEFVFTSRTNAVVFEEYVTSLRAFLLHSP